MKKVSVNIQGKYKSGGTISKSIIIEVPQNFSLSGDTKRICNELQGLLIPHPEIEKERLSEFYVSSFSEK
jgi:hypothetical protein